MATGRSFVAALILRDSISAVTALMAREATTALLDLAAGPRRSIRGRQPAHDELDLVSGEFSPGFDLGHVGRLGETLEPFARLCPRFVARQAKSLPPPGGVGRRRGRSVCRVGRRRGQQDRSASWSRSPSALLDRARLPRFLAVGESGIARRNVRVSAEQGAGQAAVDEGEAERDHREADELLRG